MSDPYEAAVAAAYEILGKDAPDVPELVKHILGAYQQARMKPYAERWVKIFAGTDRKSGGARKHAWISSYPKGKGGFDV